MSKATQPSDDEIDDQPITQRVVGAAWPFVKPTAAVSAFDAGRRAAPSKQSRRSPADPPPVDIEIHRGVPIPNSTNARRKEDPYGKILARMAPGDMVEIEYDQLRGMRGRAKALGIPISARSPMTGGKSRVWRLAEKG